MMRVLSRIAACFVLGGVLAAQQQEPPRFTASVEVTSIDVNVVDANGKPVEGLGVGDFVVSVDGEPRRVVTADWVGLATPPGTSGPPPAPEGYTSNEHSAGGRLILIVVDEPNIRFGAAAMLRNAVDGFIDRLQPSDRIAAVGTGAGALSTPFTSDRQRVKDAVARMAGQRTTLEAVRYRVGLAEALDVRRGSDPTVLSRIVLRECAGEVPDTPEYQVCVMAVQMEAERQAQIVTSESETTLWALRRLLTGLAVIDAPKTIVLVSEGFVAGDNTGGYSELSALAAAARTSLYALRLDEPMFDITQQRAPIARLEDRQVKSEGLEMLVGATRGSLFTVRSSGDAAFEQIEGELSGYYLLGVETEPGDKDGGRHPIRVRVNRSNVTVRARRDLAAATGDRGPRGARAAIAAALGSPLPIAALPLRTATFSLRAPDERVQVLIHAEVGANYSAPRLVTLGFYIADAAGRLVDTRTVVARLQPVMNGVPSPLQYTGSASLPPGDYTLKLAAAEGDTVGTVEHPIHARLLDAPPLALSELMVGGPVDARPKLSPTVSHTVSFGTVHGYMEAYGPGATGIAVKYEVVADPDDSPLLDADVTPRMAGDDRAIFTHTLPVRQLPPGAYQLRAVVTTDGKPLQTLTRAFEVAPPAVLLTSAEAGASAAPPAEIFLPVADEHFIRTFRREEATRDDVLNTFRGRVAAPLAAAFDAGVTQLSFGDYPGAERSFKSAIQTDSDSTAAFAYLAAVFAAAGHDAQAAGAWQTALIEGEDLPQIYAWLADALIRIRDLAQARAILEEALVKWPADARFAKPMALVYATFGQGREAVRTLIRHLDAQPDDLAAQALAVEWIYTLHASGATARTRSEDVNLARRYASSYQKAKGPNAALVRQWLNALDARR
jgi:VWFA-related protein